ncbi:hypothetical protein VT930_20230 [Mycobacterium sherrisii]|uniref:hypothetical protein n=1 Tax=Mycobacterium sherrisii TaxID=243061 RepID=UPI002DDCD7FE|nr:hypothetical protein [Mycobacterium sherrisii]MEC4765406.1 hypothetical protein [Mycobacterium sherrisii]
MTTATLATTTTTTTEPDASKATDSEIDAAILTALADAGGRQRPVRWTTIERRIPGTVWQQEVALTRLWHAWKVDVLKVRGRTYLEISGPHDAMIAAKHGRTTRVMPVVP